jgi:hypothetical protein
LFRTFTYSLPYTKNTFCTVEPDMRGKFEEEYLGLEKKTNYGDSRPMKN